MSDFLTIDEILLIHQRSIEEFGGSPGLRDKGALESALMRPQTGYYQDMIEESAALMESLAMNHPFVAFAEECSTTPGSASSRHRLH